MFSVKRASGVYMKNANRSKVPEMPDKASPRAKAYYSQEDAENIDYLRDVSFPGQPPYLRGITPEMFRREEWELFLCVESPDLDGARKEIRTLASNGMTSFSLSFDPVMDAAITRPALIEWTGENYAGLRIRTAGDFRYLLNSVRSLDCKIGFHSGYSAPQVMAMYMSYLLSGRKGLGKMKGFVENNVFEAPSLFGSSKLRFPFDFSVKMSISLIEYLLNEAPDFSPLTISGYNLRESGSSEAQEIAFVIASALTYLKHADNAGIDVSELLKRLSFVLGAGMDLPLEVAKFRAARRLWYSSVRSQFPGLDDDLLRFRFIARPLKSLLTDSDTEINSVRSTIQAMAAVLGGAQGIAVSSGKPYTDTAARDILSGLMMHRIIANESSVTDTIDPLGGSYYVESMTNDIEKTARSDLMKFQDLGSFETAVETGYVYSVVRTNSEKMRDMLSSGEKLVVERNILAAHRRGKHLNAKTGSKAFYNPAGTSTNDIARVKHVVRHDKFLDAISDCGSVDVRLIGLLIDAFRHGHSLTDVSDALFKLSRSQGQKT